MNVKLTAPQKLKQLFVFKAIGQKYDSPEDIEAKLDQLDGELHDIESEVRYGTEETGLDCESCRHYESKAVAAQMLDGSWVGWTYWYGGGKHGEPGAIEWVDDAYDLEMTEVQRVVREFKKKEPE